MTLRDLIRHIRTKADAVQEWKRTTRPGGVGSRTATTLSERRGNGGRGEHLALRVSHSIRLFIPEAQGCSGDDEDHKTSFWAMKESSDIVSHRTPPAGNHENSRDSELKADIDALDAYRETVEKRVRRPIA